MARPLRKPPPRHRSRTVFGFAVLALAWAALAWSFSPGLPVMWGPSASAADIAAGCDLFEHEWTPNDPLAHGDGLGPMYNATSCVACHFQGGAGGGGDNKHNATAFEILPTRRVPELREGTIHAFCTDPQGKESFAVLKKQHPTIRLNSRAVSMAGCGPAPPRDVDPVRTTPVQTTALFGAGWLDRIPEKAIAHCYMAQSLDKAAKEFQADFSNTVGSGRLRTLPDGRIGKFGWKAQFATLEEFVAAACANELGLGTPTKPQAKSFVKPAAGDVKPDLDAKQFRQLLAYIDTLPRPAEVLPTHPAQRSAAIRGKAVFAEVGCAACHVPDLGGVKGVYSDFRLHVLEDPNDPSGGGYDPLPPDEPPVPEDHPKLAEWKTPPLWGVADTAPYLHDGSAATLEGAIDKHRGDAKSVREAYKALPEADRAALIQFLKTLKAPVASAPAAQVAKR